MRRHPIALALLVLALACAGCALTLSEAAPEPASSASAPRHGANAIASDARPRLSVPVGLVPGQEVTIRASGLKPGHKFLLVQCVRESLGTRKPLDHVCDLTVFSQVLVTADARGRVSRTYEPRGAIGVGVRTDVNCLRTACSLALADSHDRVVVSAPMRWRTGASLPKRPRLVITSIDREPGTIWGSATVVGSGYAPMAEVVVAQCPARAPGASVDAVHCLNASSFQADGSGGFAGRLRVAFEFQRSNGELINCDSSPRRCALAVPFPKGYATRMSRVLFSTVLVP